MNHFLDAIGIYMMIALLVVMAINIGLVFLLLKHLNRLVKNQAAQDNAIFKNKMQTADRAIVLFSEMKTIIEKIRSPSIYIQEKSQIQNMEAHNEFTTNLKKPTNLAPAICLLRLEQHENKLDELKALQVKFRILFGTDKPFNDIFDLWVKLERTAKKLLKKEKLSNREIQKYQSVINENEDIDDEIQESIAYRMIEIEKICKQAVYNKDVIGPLPKT